MPVPDAAPEVDLPDVLQFMRLLWAIVHGVQRTSKRMAGTIGVTGPQRLVLRVVGLFPDVSAGDLAAILHVHPSTLTGVIRRLVAQRLLVREDDPRDRRRARLRLTPRGQRVNRMQKGTVEAAVAATLNGVAPRDRAATARVLAHLADGLHANAAPPIPHMPPGGRPLRPFDEQRGEQRVDPMR
jgi:MarR family transcriptional regulator, organic hydroperoxide resistance regulator